MVRAQPWIAVAGLVLAACGSTIGDPAGGDPDGGGVSPDAATPAPLPADAAPAPDAQPCVEGDAQTTDPLTGSCYMLFLTKSTWDTARNNCQTLGGHLVTAADQAENDRFAAIAPTDPATTNQDVWIGATDAALEGDWQWHNGEAMVFEGWRLDPPEPNNGGADGPVEHCAIIEGDNGGTWDDRPCTSLFVYMCERD